MNNTLPQQPEFLQGELPGEIITSKNPGYNYEGTGFGLHFQQGSINDGINGLTDMDAIKITIHKLTYHQKEKNGMYACKETAMAITKLQEAYMWLKERRENRLKRGVYGKELP